MAAPIRAPATATLNAFPKPAPAAAPVAVVVPATPAISFWIEETIPLEVATRLT
jgi:hypothetical protein